MTGPLSDDAPSSIVQQMPDSGDEALEQFTDYFRRNYPGPNTVIMDPNWHAPRIFRAAVRAYETISRATEADLAGLRAQHAAWSQAQIGDVSAVGPAKHLVKEAMEVAADPLDPIEHADCWMLLWYMQRRAGISDAQLADAIREKLAINQARKWPEDKA